MQNCPSDFSLICQDLFILYQRMQAIELNLNILHLSFLSSVKMIPFMISKGMPLVGEIGLFYVLNGCKELHWNKPRFLANIATV